MDSTPPLDSSLVELHTFLAYITYFEQKIVNYRYNLIFYMSCVMPYIMPIIPIEREMQRELGRERERPSKRPLHV